MKTLKKWGKPVTSVQVFTPQEYVAGCDGGPALVIPAGANCGVGIEDSAYADDLAGAGQGKAVAVKLKGQSAQHIWYPCPEQHPPILIDALKSGQYDVAAIYVGPSGGSYNHQIENPTNIYGYMAPDAVHIFYVDLNNIPNEYEKIPMS